MNSADMRGRIRLEVPEHVNNVTYSDEENEEEELSREYGEMGM